MSSRPTCPENCPLQQRCLALAERVEATRHNQLEHAFSTLDLVQAIFSEHGLDEQTLAETLGGTEEHTKHYKLKYQLGQRAEEWDHEVDQTLAALQRIAALARLYCEEPKRQKKYKMVGAGTLKCSSLIDVDKAMRTLDAGPASQGRAAQL